MTRRPHLFIEVSFVLTPCDWRVSWWRNPGKYRDLTAQFGPFRLTVIDD